MTTTKRRESWTHVSPNGGSGHRTASPAECRRHGGVLVPDVALPVVDEDDPSMCTPKTAAATGEYSRGEDDADEPVALVLAAWPNPTSPGALLVEVRCPCCRSTHWHGIPAGQLIVGSDRSSHCVIRVEGCSGYTLDVEAEVTS